MEIVGGVASIITLIEATGVLIEVSKKLISRWQNAPHEIQALATRLSLLAAELHSIKNATSTSHPVLTDAIIRQSLSDLLTDVRKRLMKLESLHYRLEQHKPVYQRIRWTVKDADSVEKMLSKTQEVEQRLANLMTLISLKAQTPILDGIERIEQMVSTLVVSLPVSANVTSTPSTTRFTPSFAAQHSKSAPRSLTSSSWNLDKSWEAWGLRGRQITTRTASHINRNITFTIPISLGRILGDYAIIGNLSIQSTPLCWGFLTFRHPSYFAVARVVDSDNPFMDACSQGDIQTVRLMLRSGEGRPTDVTRGGWTPMTAAAIQSNVEVVMELLDCGTDIDAITDTKFQNSALGWASLSKQLDVVRLLLRLGASVLHADGSNFPISAFCWSESDDSTDYSSIELFKLFAESELLDSQSYYFSVTGSLWFASQRACKRQIHQLIGLGADPHDGMSGGDAPIHRAIFWGNQDAYLALLPYHADIFLANEHQSSLYLLLLALAGKAAHIAKLQELGHSRSDPPRDHDRILLDLLQRGVNPGRRLTLQLDGLRYATDEWGPEPNAHELAARFGPETAAWYLGVLDGFCSQSAQQDHRQSHGSTKTGRGAAGFIYEDEHNSDVSEEGEDIGGTSNSEETDVQQSHILDPRNDLEDDSNSDVVEQFWDANEIVH